MNTWYYGTRYARGCHPKDLWTTYFTSSKYVQEHRKQYGEPDVIQIRKTFQTEKETRKWEIKVLKRMRVVKSKQWLNKTDREGPSRLGILLSEEHKAKISAAKKRKA